jgi:hypothetical protein
LEPFVAMKNCSHDIVDLLDSLQIKTSCERISYIHGEGCYLIFVLLFGGSVELSYHKLLTQDLVQLILLKVLTEKQAPHISTESNQVLTRAHVLLQILAYTQTEVVLSQLFPCRI